MQNKMNRLLRIKQPASPDRKLWPCADVEASWHVTGAEVHHVPHIKKLGYEKPRRSCKRVLDPHSTQKPIPS